MRFRSLNKDINIWNAKFRGHYLETEDEAIINRIKASPKFNVTIFVDDGSAQAKTEQATGKPLMEVFGFNADLEPVPLKPEPKAAKQRRIPNITRAKKRGITNIME